VIFSVQISQEIIKLRKIGKRDEHIILKVIQNEIIKKYIAVAFKYAVYCTYKTDLSCGCQTAHSDRQCFKLAIICLKNYIC
jgi:hypothetical protein